MIIWPKSSALYPSVCSLQSFHPLYHAHLPTANPFPCTTCGEAQIPDIPSPYNDIKASDLESKLVKLQYADRHRAFVRSSIAHFQISQAVLLADVEKLKEKKASLANNSARGDLGEHASDSMEMSY
jgi:hypothetical protein